jgi:hypothetical protein
MTDLAATALSNSLEGYSWIFYHSQDQRPQHNRMPDSEAFDIAGNLWRPKTGLVHVCGLLVDGYRYGNVKLGAARVSAPPRVHISVKTRVLTRVLTTHALRHWDKVQHKSHLCVTDKRLVPYNFLNFDLQASRGFLEPIGLGSYRKIDSPPIEPFVGLIRLLQY